MDGVLFVRQTTDQIKRRRKLRDEMRYMGQIKAKLIHTPAKAQPQIIEVHPRTGHADTDGEYEV